MMKLERIAGIIGVTILGCIHLYTIGDGTVLGILIGVLSTLAGVAYAQTSKEEN